VLWAPKWLPGRPEDKRDPFEVVKKFGGLISGEEVYAEEVTDLSQWLRARLNPPVSPIRAVLRLLVASPAPEDDDLTIILANRLQAESIRVQPMLTGEPPPVGDVDPFPSALVTWGNADRAAIDALLAVLVSFVPRITVLHLPGGDEPAKRRFFRAGVYSESLEVLPPDRRTARELLVRLGIASSGDEMGA
jgi:hypothetical protein